jgi:hypothetical protein
VRVDGADKAVAASHLASAADELCSPHTAFLVEAADKAARALVHGAPAAGAASQQRVDELAPAGGEAPATVTPLVGCADGASASAPSLRWAPDGGVQRCVEVHVDVLLLASPQQALASAVGGPSLRAALQAQLGAVASALHAAPACVPLALHFQPPGLAHSITAVYALPPGPKADDADAGLTAARAALHARWGLPCNRPLLRLACALPPTGSWAGAATAGDAGRLRDVHLRCPPSGVPGGVSHTVCGSYLYYHYRQDRFDDAGWGCAYRSCQTLVSWFRLQSYTSLAVPSHGDMQALLVRMGDKEASFAGSRQWMGAVELMYVLNEVRARAAWRHGGQTACRVQAFRAARARQPRSSQQRHPACVHLRRRSTCPVKC